MADATILLDEDLFYTERFRVVLKVYEVEPSKKYPSGIKAGYVLVDVEKNQPRLLVDNHEPFGFHMHTELPDDNGVRVEMETEDYLEALKEFNREVRRIIENEK